MAKRRKNPSLRQQLDELLRRYLRKFFSLFPTDEDCVESCSALFILKVQSATFVGSTRIKREYGDRWVHCDDCKKVSGLLPAHFSTVLGVPKPGLD